MLPNRSDVRKVFTILLQSSWRWSPGLVAATVAIVLFRLGTWQPFENVAYRQLFRMRGERPLDSRIVVVAIDNPSINQLGEFPWPRRRYLELVSKLRQAQPRVVGFTLPFSYNSSTDRTLAQEMSRLRAVVLADSWDARKIPLQSSPELRAAAQVGHVQGNEDTDGVVRSIELIKNNQPAFGLAVSRAAQYNSDPDLGTNDYWINWGSSSPAIPTYSFARVLRSDFNTQLLANKIVLVGVTTQGMDRVGTPFDRNSSGSGVYLQATVIDNLIQHRRLQIWAEPGLLLLLLLISPLLSWQLSYYSHGRRLIAVFAIGVGWVIVSIVGLHFNYLVWVVAPLALIGLTGIAVAFSEKLYVDSLIERRILHLWQAHQIDLIARQNILPSTPTLPSFSKVAKLATLAAEFGRAQSAQAAITHSLSLGLVATELDGTVWFCNSVASRWLQINVGEKIERCLIPTWLSAADWHSNLYSLSHCSYITPKEIQLGEQFFILKMEPLLNWQTLQRDIEDGKSIEEARVVSGVLLIIEEITASKQLQSLILDVEIQRRQELTKQNIALNKARQLAESAASIKSVFLANMSHEIRTPMNAVVGLTNLLLETPLNSEQEEFVATIKVSADHLLKIINEILDFSKLESGEMQLESIAFNLNELVEQVLSVLANSAHRKGLNLSYWIDPHVPKMVQGDPTRLNQILTNLIGNAIKFTEQGGVMVDVRPSASDPSQIEIAITDTGIGISPDNQHKLFQSFSQADASTTRQYGGTGLGLAICQRLLELMGGKIGVESALDRGSKFWLQVPLVALSVPPPAQAPPQLLQQVSILIVDSWLHRLQALAKDAAQWGMVVSAHSSVEPELLVTPQIALVDWSTSNTHQLVEQLVEQRIPTIVMITFDRYESARAKLGDRVSYLFKPIKPMRLVSLLPELLAPSGPLAIAAEPLAQSIAPAPRPIRNLSHVQILLAEDNQINQKVALRQLSKLGYQVDVANNGQEVLEKLEQKPYDLILMDCHMPILDGYATTAAIRQLPEPRRHQTVIVALTASVMQSDLEHALAVGMNDFLSKPVQIEQLQQMIEQWLGR